jgi:putative drug exporter of the RND superfamily
MTRLSGWLLRHKLVVLGVWLVVLLVGVVLAPAVSQRLSTDFSLPGQPGYQANLAIAETYGSGGHAHPIVPVITLPPGVTVDTPGVREALGRGFASVAAALPARVVSYASSGDRRLVSADGRTTYGLVFLSDDGAVDRGDPADATAAALRGALPAGTALEVTGIDQLSAHDDGGSAGAEVVNLTLIGGLGALAVLLLVFGSVLALAPLLVAAVSILATLLLVGLLTVLTEVNLIVEYLVALIGLGVAIDYSLLLVTRWREERAAGHAGDQAVHRAMASAGRSVVLSASTVAVGVAAVAGLAILGGFTLRLQVGDEQASSLAGGGPAHQGLVALRAAGVPAGVLTPIEVLVPAGAATDPMVLASGLARVPGVWAAVAPTEPAWRRAGTALVEVAAVAGPGTRAGQQTVQRVRATVQRLVPGARVGGVGAENLDFARAVYGRFPLMVAVIAAITFVLLARAFRSLLLAAKAVAVELLSIGATFGAIVLVWQLGHGARALGGVGGTGALDSFVPLFVFAFLYGLSMDYEVFLLARMREAYDGTGSTVDAVLQGVGRTGRLVTSAALILFLAFASLAGARDTVTKIFATGLGAGILLDATVVRCLLVPGLVSLLGRWNWWLPAWAARPLAVAPSAAAAEPTPRQQLATPDLTSTGG